MSERFFKKTLFVALACRRKDGGSYGVSIWITEYFPLFCVLFCPRDGCYDFYIFGLGIGVVDERYYNPSGYKGNDLLFFIGKNTILYRLPFRKWQWRT